MSDELCLLSATQLLHGYRLKRFSPLEVAEAILKRIDRLDPKLNAFCLRDDDAVRQAARASSDRWAKGSPEGRLDGVPTTIKDLLLTKGWPTLRGSTLVDRDQPWGEDAPSVANLRAENALFLGKTTTPEFGWKGVTDSKLTGITRNPWNLERTPGGSSGGAAAACAAGLGALHYGTDGGGSIRIPAGFSGIFGIKPSFGRVPAYPASPFGTVAHVGPMTRTVADAALMLTVMTKPDIRDWYQLPHPCDDFRQDLEPRLAGLRVAYSPTLNGQPVQPAVARLVEAAALRFRELGATVVEATPKIPDCGPIFRILWFVGAAHFLSAFTPEQRKQIDPGLQRAAEEGAKVQLFDYIATMKARESLGAALKRFHADHDLLLLPTLPIVAFEAGLERPPGQDGWTDWTPFSYPFNLSQQPAATVPCGLTDEGLPAGLQIVGPPHRDDLVLKAAHAYEMLVGGFPAPPMARAR